MPRPVIAAVNGFAMGGGCEIALACHLVVADATARFALSEVKVGLVAGAGGLIRLARMEETRGLPDVVEAVKYPCAAFDELMASEDAIEGMTAFAAERCPQWRSR